MKTPRSGTIAFRPRARLLKLIGEELLSDEVVALAELVKNAHDADARHVLLSFQGVTAPGGRIVVQDDGHGMDLDTLLGRWMEPAASTKIAADRKVTCRGRRVLGEKGVGRFAADKIARQLELVSRQAGSPDEVRACIDWDRYASEEALLSEVENHWEVRPTRVIDPHGTVLSLADTRAVWTERMFRRLCLRLSRLLSPFRRHDPFAIRIESDEFPDYAGELRQDLLDRAPYRVEASFDGQETITVAINGGAASEHRWNGQGELACGPVQVRLFAFDLEGEALARLGPRLEVRAWLKAWTGVSIYRDGFRVWPYGEPHDDWLRLDQRRVNNPVEHLSNNQIIGFVDIGRDSNPELLDQTNREGLIHNRALDDLRRLLYVVLQAIEAHRQSIRHPVRREARRATAGGTLADLPVELEALAGRTSGKVAEDLRALRTQVEERLARHEQHTDRLLEGYLGLAALGQLGTSLLAGLPQLLEELADGLEELRKPRSRSSGEGADLLLRLATAALDQAREQLRLVSQVGGNSDRRRAIDLVQELENFTCLIGPQLVEAEVRLDVDVPTEGVHRIEMRPEAFHGILHILTDNALHWLRAVRAGRIRIAVEPGVDHYTLLFSDNGPGVAADLGDRIFEAGVSSRSGGRGMGLTLARRVLEKHGGGIDLVKDGRRKGACFRLTLPPKRSRATIGGR